MHVSHWGRGGYWKEVTGCLQEDWPLFRSGSPVKSGRCGVEVIDSVSLAGNHILYTGLSDCISPYIYFPFASPWLH